ncbi:hypothetical protein TNCT_362941 [Trichonephila clavata]|uniref:Uncharacterized protein n=1 Tax=Trichonephila clavata TaxID=2740835 RepID=A0A8X6LS09_TRICU|nr:hypothetical protein TNCT_362941 [Trichonephila clavata]
MGDSKKHENKVTRKIISLETKMQVIRRLDTVTQKCLKEVWKNIWPGLSKDGDSGHSVNMNEIVELAKQTSLGEVNVEDVEEIEQETAASLSNDELKELANQEQKIIESGDQK